MKKRFLFFIYNLIIIIPTQTKDLTSLFDTKTLSNTTLTQSILKNHGFQKVTFFSQDNYKLHGLFLDQSTLLQTKIQGTIIFCAGFYPGTKEGMTTFYAMLHDQPYNFLFFDARGHNESDGKLFSYSSIKAYGSTEFQDVIAALDFVHEYNHKHHIAQAIFLHGMCAGGFHCIKALAHLKKQTHQTLPAIKGLIVDSGWSSIVDIVEPIIYAEVENRLKNTYFSFLQKPIAYSLIGIYRLLFKQHHHKLDSINNCIACIDCPILFIHGKNDIYVPITSIDSLIQKARKPYSWILDSHDHAVHHLKQKQNYTKIINDFLSNNIKQDL